MEIFEQEDQDKNKHWAACFYIMIDLDLILVITSQYVLTIIYNINA